MTYLHLFVLHYLDAVVLRRQFKTIWELYFLLAGVLHPFKRGNPFVEAKYQKV